MQFNSSFLENEIQTTTGKTLAPSAPKQRSALGGLSLNAGGKASSSTLSSSTVHSSYSDDIEFCSTTSSALPFSSSAASFAASNEELFGKSSSVMSMKKLRSLGTSVAASSSLPTMKLSKLEVDESSLSSMKMNHFVANPITSGGYKPSSFAVYEEDVVDDNAAQVEEANLHNKVVEEEWTFKEFDD